MATYGMKDAANLVLINKKTNKVATYIDYANSTNAEFTSETTYATKKGANAIAWDGARTGKLTVEAELFDLQLLALMNGTEVKEGAQQIFRHEDYVVDASKILTLSAVPEADSISVFKLKSDRREHDGSQLLRANIGGSGSIPKMPENVSVTAKDVTASISWDASAGATGYLVMRDGAQVGNVVDTSYEDAGLTPEKSYKYTVVAINSAGQSAPSAVVVAATVKQGGAAATAVKATADAISAAKAAEEGLTAGSVTFTVNGANITLSDNAQVGDAYVVYFLEEVPEARTLSIYSDKFAGNFEIFADAFLRNEETSEDEFVQIHYLNAKPQANFTMNQSAKEPTSLSLVFDLFPAKNDEGKDVLCEYKVVE